jgi:hypothetical protein
MRAFIMIKGGISLTLPSFQLATGLCLTRQRCRQVMKIDISSSFCKSLDTFRSHLAEGADSDACPGMGGEIVVDTKPVIVHALLIQNAN